MNENEILGFDPTQLSVFNNNEENLGNSYIENEEFFIDEEYDRELEEEYRKIEENHIDGCLRSKNFKIRKPIYVYLAGKIEQNGWRETIVGYRCGGLMPWQYDDLTNYCVECGNAIVTGPWFLACDHGCYHGENNHGLGTYGIGCAQEGNYTEEEVYDICLTQILKSEMLFAYINDDTCYGSLYEIGYAKALGLKVVLIFDNKERMSKMWFMCRGADIVEVLDENQNIRNKFDEIINKISR